MFLLLLQFDEKLKRNGAKANVDCSIGIKETRERNLAELSTELRTKDF